MNSHEKSRLVFGAALILAGAAFLAFQLVPGLQVYLANIFTWPMIIIGVGVMLFVLSLLSGSSDTAIPASIITGVGIILYYQNISGNWASWSYAWTLFPAFVGFGQIVSGLLSSRPQEVSHGLEAILVSAVLFGIFGAFLGGFTLLGPYWPLLLIAAGLLLILRALLPRP
jgi:hypothetical protein